MLINMSSEAKKQTQLPNLTSGTRFMSLPPPFQSTIRSTINCFFAQKSQPVVNKTVRSPTRKHIFSRRIIKDSLQDMQGFLTPLSAEQVKQKKLQILAKRKLVQAQRYSSFDLPYSKQQKKETTVVTSDSYNSMSLLRRVYHQFKQLKLSAKKVAKFQSSLPEDCLRLLKLVKGRHSQQSIAAQLHKSQTLKWVPYLKFQMTKAIQEHVGFALNQIVVNSPQPVPVQGNTLSLPRTTKGTNFNSRLNEFQSQYGSLMIPKHIIWTSNQITKASQTIRKYPS